MVIDLVFLSNYLIKNGLKLFHGYVVKTKRRVLSGRTLEPGRSRSEVKRNNRESALTTSKGFIPLKGWVGKNKGFEKDVNLEYQLIIKNSLKRK